MLIFDSNHASKRYIRLNIRSSNLYSIFYKIEEMVLFKGMTEITMICRKIKWILLKTKRSEQKSLTHWNENCSVHLNSFSFHILSWDSLLSQLKLSRLVRSIYMSLFCSSFFVSCWWCKNFWLYAWLAF